MFLRRLNLSLPADRAIASELFLACAGYEVQSFGRLPSAEDGAHLLERFPDSCPPEHRLSFAAYRRNEPLALIQVALHKPVAEAATVLLLLVRPDEQRQHTGCEIVERLSRQARSWPGIARWELSVLETNLAGLAFWRHCGFKSFEIGVTHPEFQAGMRWMRRPIKGRPVCQKPCQQDDDANVLAARLLSRLG